MSVIKLFFAAIVAVIFVFFVVAGMTNSVLIGLIVAVVVAYMIEFVAYMIDEERAKLRG